MRGDGGYRLRKPPLFLQYTVYMYCRRTQIPAQHINPTSYIPPQYISSQRYSWSMSYPHIWQSIYYVVLSWYLSTSPPGPPNYLTAYYTYHTLIPTGYIGMDHQYPIYPPSYCQLPTGPTFYFPYTDPPHVNALALY